MKSDKFMFHASALENPNNTLRESAGCEVWEFSSCRGSCSCLLGFDSHIPFMSTGGYPETLNKYKDYHIVEEYSGRRQWMILAGSVIVLRYC